MDVKNACLPEAAHRHSEVRLFSRCVEPFERPFREHRHFPFEAALIRGGSGLYTTQRAVYPIGPGDVFLFACNEIHCVTRIDPGAPLRLTNIHIDPAFLWPAGDAPLTPRFLAMPFSHSTAFENRLAAGTQAARDIAALMLGLKLSAGILWALLFLMPAALFFIALGLLCGSVLGVKQVGGLCGALLTNLTAWLSGVWFDIDLVGGAFRAIANVLPFVHAVELERAAFSGDWAAVPAQLVWVLLWTLPVCALAVGLFLRQMKRQ